MRWKRVLFAAWVAVGVAASACGTGVYNPGFDLGDLTGWEAIGTASVVDGGFGVTPIDGTRQALLNNGDGVDFPTAATIDELAAFVGVTVDQLEALTVNDWLGTRGSAIRQQVTVKAGERLHFYWDFLTNERQAYEQDPTGGAVFDDTAFFFVTPGDAQRLAGAFDGATPSANLIDSATVFFHETGYGDFTYQFDFEGTYHVGFGVMHGVDSGVASGLLIDAVTIYAPAPATVAMGCVLLGLQALRRRCA